MFARKFYLFSFWQSRAKGEVREFAAGLDQLPNLIFALDSAENIWHSVCPLSMPIVLSAVAVAVLVW